eukprot:363740-Chlamydomonas_euryale.AAC.33
MFGRGGTDAANSLSFTPSRPCKGIGSALRVLRTPPTLDPAAASPARPSASSQADMLSPSSGSRLGPGTLPARASVPLPCERCPASSVPSSRARLQQSSDTGCWRLPGCLPAEGVAGWAEQPEWTSAEPSSRRLGVQISWHTEALGSAKALGGTLGGAKALGGTLGGAKALGGALGGAKAPGGALGGAKALGGALGGAKALGGALGGAKALGGALGGAKALGGALGGAKALGGTLGGAKALGGTLGGAQTVACSTQALEFGVSMKPCDAFRRMTGRERWLCVVTCRMEVCASSACTLCTATKQTRRPTHSPSLRRFADRSRWRSFPKLCKDGDIDVLQHSTQAA